MIERRLQTTGVTYNFLKITNSGTIVEMSLQPIINIWGKNAQAGQQTYKQVYEQNK